MMTAMMIMMMMMMMEIMRLKVRNRKRMVMTSRFPPDLPKLRGVSGQLSHGDADHDGRVSSDRGSGHDDGDDDNDDDDAGKDDAGDDDDGGADVAEMMLMEKYLERLIVMVRSCVRGRREGQCPASDATLPLWVCDKTYDWQFNPKSSLLDLMFQVLNTGDEPKDYVIKVTSIAAALEYHIRVANVAVFPDCNTATAAQ